MKGVETRAVLFHWMVRLCYLWPLLRAPWQQCNYVMYFRLVDDVIFSRNGTSEPESIIRQCFVEFAMWRHRRRSCCLGLQACNLSVKNPLHIIKTLFEDKFGGTSVVSLSWCKSEIVVLYEIEAKNNTFVVNNWSKCRRSVHKLKRIRRL